uniref:Uncharacterized protein n=1 Tax=viral metagenome TaxID=1070528 RepID=A0A6C0C5J1_9ZZZZ
MSKYNKHRCLLCKGIGLVKRKEKDKCLYCDKNSLSSCCCCEFKYFIGQYKECSECLGMGEIWVNKTTNKETLVWCLSN